LVSILGLNLQIQFQFGKSINSLLIASKCLLSQFIKLHVFKQLEHLHGFWITSFDSGSKVAHQQLKLFLRISISSSSSCSQVSVVLELSKLFNCS
jgi:hypothetical protein